MKNGPENYGRKKKVIANNLILVRKNIFVVFQVENLEVLIFISFYLFITK